MVPLSQILLICFSVFCYECQVSGDGDVLYVLPKDYRSVLLAKSLKLRLEPLVEKIKVSKAVLCASGFHSTTHSYENSELYWGNFLRMHIFKKAVRTSFCRSSILIYLVF